MGVLLQSPSGPGPGESAAQVFAAGDAQHPSQGPADLAKARPIYRLNVRREVMQSKLWKAGAFISAAWCWLRWHDVRWATNQDPDCPRGDVECITCNTIWWCRAHG